MKRGRAVKAADRKDKRNSKKAEVKKERKDGRCARRFKEAERICRLFLGGVFPVMKVIFRDLHKNIM